MRAGVHKDMAYQVLTDWSKASALTFLLKGVAKPGWKKSMTTKRKWLKEWMDMPDSNKHSSKLKNDHSYKLAKVNNKLRIMFAKSGDDQATVVARLKYAARAVKEWAREEEFRSCALELAKSIHWVIDMSSPSHLVAGWRDTDHSKIESDFDRAWKAYYVKGKVRFNRKKVIQDIYRWARTKIQNNYGRNVQLKQLYGAGGSIMQGEGKAMGREVVQEVAQNLADYLAYIDRLVDFNRISKKLP